MLQLDDIGTADFWAEASDEHSGRTPVTVVLPSGRSQFSMAGHLALISDALFTHEIVSEIDRLSGEAKCSGVTVTSLLDIDFYELIKQNAANGSQPDSSAPAAADLLNSNLLVIASPRVNIVAKLLLEACESFERYGSGFSIPYEACTIYSGTGQMHPWDPNVGVLSGFLNPWSSVQHRWAFLCAGFLATGTIAANRLLLDFLKGERHGNNAHREGSPVKIVTGKPRHYSCALIDLGDLVPQLDLRNIEPAITVEE